MKRKRIILYSHDGMGIGHIRRNLLLAGALSEGGANDILLIAGVVEAGAFELPPHVDCLTLPALRKLGNGRYQARRLNVPTNDLVSLRSAIIRTAVEAFRPDAMIIDKVPRGVANELQPTLELLRGNHNCKLILGLREVLDEPQVVQEEWDREGNWKLVEDCFDAIWIYGDAAVYDTVAEYGFPESLRQRSSYTGYLQRSITEALPDANLPDRPYALCFVGGGEDGGPLALAFAQSTFPASMQSVIIAGPFMPAEPLQKLHQLAAENPGLQVLNFVPDPSPWLHAADRVVAMGGYNSVSEVMCARKPALIVPRVLPRQEQWLRARRLENLGIIDVLHPDDLSPARITEWLHRDTTHQRNSVSAIDFEGLKRLPKLLRELLALKPRLQLNIPHQRKLHATR